MFSNSFCSSEDQMMIGARFVFVNFWCKQKLFGKGIVVLGKTDRRLIICWLSYMVEPTESICLDLVCSWVQMGLPLVQQYLIQFERLARKLVPQVGEHFENEMMNLSMYASQWFITIFSHSFPFSLALWIWDVFLAKVVSCASLSHALFW